MDDEGAIGVMDSPPETAETPPAASTPTGEAEVGAPPKPEISEEEIRSIRTTEIQTAASNTEHRLMYKTRKELQDVSASNQQEKEKKQEDILNGDEGKAALMVMLTIDEFSDGRHEGQSIPKFYSAPIEINGKHITKLTATADGKFSYKFKTSPDADIEAEGDELLSREGLMQSVLIQRADKIAALLPENQRGLVGAHAAILKDGETAVAGKSITELDAMIDQGAEQTNMVTSNDILAFAQKTMSEPEIQQLQAILAGHKLPTVEIYDRILNMASFDTRIEMLNKEVNKIEESISRVPPPSNIEDLKEALDTARGLQEQFGQMGQQVRNGEAQKIFDRAAAGRIDNTTARTIKTAIRNGDVDSAVEALFKELQPTGDPGEDAKRARKKREAKKKLQMVGGGLGILAILLLMAGAEITKTMASQK